jgi:hypothetical protein
MAHGRRNFYSSAMSVTVLALGCRSDRGILMNGSGK